MQGQKGNGDGDGDDEKCEIFFGAHSKLSDDARNISGKRRQQRRQRAMHGLLLPKFISFLFFESTVSCLRVCWSFNFQFVCSLVFFISPLFLARFGSFLFVCLMFSSMSKVIYNTGASPTSASWLLVMYYLFHKWVHMGTYRRKHGNGASASIRHFCEININSDTFHTFTGRWWFTARFSFLLCEYAIVIVP